MANVVGIENDDVPNGTSESDSKTGLGDTDIAPGLDDNDTLSGVDQKGSFDVGKGADFKLIGEVVFLYAHAKERLNYSILDITTDVVLPIKLNQYRIYWVNQLPVGFATWLYVSDDLLERLINDEIVELTVDDWRCGKNIWLLDLLAPFGHGRVIANELRRDTFANAVVHSMRRYPDGRTRHTIWRGKNVNRREREAV